jgi:lipopolysaccharide export system protein LptA
MTIRRALLAILLASPSMGAQGIAAPSGRCVFRFDNLPTTRVTGSKLPSGQYNNFIGGGVVARCPQQSLILKSDSLEQYGDEGRYYFVGHVDYAEPRLALKSEFLTYFQRDERLLATRNVNARLPSGSTLVGPQVEFLRAVPGIRPQQSATAIGRPTINLVERDTAGRPQPPVKVTGNTVYLQGDSVVSAVGNVVVVRPELTATGDSLYADAGTGLLRIMRQPKITGTKGRPFTLVGETIDLLSQQKKLRRVLAKQTAEATSEDLDLKSDSIDLRVNDDLLQRAVVWGTSRAHATSPTQSIVADSIDVLMPAQHVTELHAVRRATAEAVPDTTKFHTTEKDRLTGDTIVAYFDSVPAHDTTAKPRIRLLVATGNATSLQHLPPRDSTFCVPAINYVKGRSITVQFDSAKKVSTVTVHDSAQSPGVYIEPDSTSGRAGCRKVAATPTAHGLPVPPPNPRPSSPVPTTPAIVPRRP